MPPARWCAISLVVLLGLFSLNGLSIQPAEAASQDQRQGRVTVIQTIPPFEGQPLYPSTSDDPESEDCLLARVISVGP